LVEETFFEIESTFWSISINRLNTSLCVHL